MARCAKVVQAESFPLLGLDMGRTETTHGRSRKNVVTCREGSEWPLGTLPDKVKMDRDLDETEEAGEERRIQQHRKAPWRPPRCEWVWKQVPRVASIVPVQILS